MERRTSPESLGSERWAWHRQHEHEEDVPSDCSSSCINQDCVKAQDCSEKRFAFIFPDSQNESGKSTDSPTRAIFQSPAFKDLKRRLELPGAGPSSDYNVSSNGETTEEVKMVTNTCIQAVPPPPPLPPPPPPPLPPSVRMKAVTARVMKKVKTIGAMRGKSSLSPSLLAKFEPTPKDSSPPPPQPPPPPPPPPPLPPISFPRAVALAVSKKKEILRKVAPKTFDLSSPNARDPVRSTTRKLPPRTCDRPTQLEKPVPSDKSHFAKAGEFLFHLYEHDQLTDVVVHCGAYTFSAHAIVLAAHSPFFSRALLGGVGGGADRRRQHVSLAAEVSANAFHVLLDYMYSGDLLIEAENVAELLAASLALGMVEVENKCRSQLEHLSPEQLMVVWEMAERNGLKVIGEQAVKLLGKTFYVVVKSSPFLRLDLDLLLSFLSRDDLPVTSEYDVADAAITWIRHEEAERLSVAARVMACVRLTLMTSEELFRVIKKAEFIFKDDEVQNMFLVANWFATGRKLDMPCSLKKPLPSKRTGVRRRDEMLKPSQEEVTEQSSQPFNVAPNCDAEPEQEFASDTSVASSCDSAQLPQHPIPVRVVRLLLMGGYNPQDRAQDSKASATMTYNRAAHRWVDHMMEMSAGRVHHTAVILNETIYIIGGSDPTSASPSGLLPTNTVFAYVIAEGTWRQAAPLNTCRTRHGACVLDGAIYVVGGRDRDGVVASVECYDLTRDVWHYVPSMTSARLGAGVAAFNRQVAVAGGYGEDTLPCKYSILDTVEFYDPNTEKWHTRAPLRTRRCHSGMVAAGGVLYLCGGLGPSATGNDPWQVASVPEVDVYDPSTDTWSLLTRLNVPRHQVAATALDGRLYVIGGMSTQLDLATPVMECYDISSATWEQDVVPLPYPIVGSAVVAATLLFDSDSHCN